MMATSAAQAAIFTRLSGDATLKGLTGNHPDDATKARVYDEPPEGSAFPYVVIGEAVERQNNRMGGKVGRSMDVFVHVWTEKRGFDEVQDIADRVDELLDNYLSLSVTGYATELLNFEDMQLLKTARGGTPLRQGIARYRLDLVES